jgi:HIRAN domain
VIWSSIVLGAAIVSAAIFAIALVQARAQRPRRIFPAGLTPKFYVDVSGVADLNADGSSRQEVIARCRLGETVLLIPEPENKSDSCAVRVCRQSGEQIGYVPVEYTAWLTQQLDIAACAQEGIYRLGLYQPGCRTNAGQADARRRDRDPQLNGEVAVKT